MEENDAPPRVPSWRLVYWFLLLIFLMEPSLTVAKTQVTSEQLNNFLEPYRQNGQNPTYTQLKDWFDTHGQVQGGTNNRGTAAITPDLYPRLFPFCVTYEQVMNTTHLNSENSKLWLFRNIFQRIKEYHDVQEKFYHFNESKHSIKFNKTFVKDVLMTRINPPEPDMLNLRQWAHITIKAKTKLQGIYVQSIVGPIGLPFGDFNLDFTCKDNSASYDMLQVGQLFYCHYRSKANLYHPRVFVGVDLVGKFEWHMHFQWSDITCLETPYLQLLIIAVKELSRANPMDGEDYAFVYSQVFVNTEFDTQDGSPYPYHPIWKDTGFACFARSTNDVVRTLGITLPAQEKKNGDSKFSPLKWKESPDIFRIQTNEEYDACIRGTKRRDILDDKDLVRLECPPGPFRCNKSYQETAGAGGATTIGSNNRVTQERENLVRNEAATSNCYPCAVPPCPELKYTMDECEGRYAQKKTQIIQHEDTKIIENISSVGRLKSHGMLAILATLVFLPMANLMGRHYKEVCRNCLCGNGPWIFIHVILHFLSAIVLWLSVGPVVASISDYNEVLIECKSIYANETDFKACAQERSARNPHVPCGIIVFVLQNLLIIFGYFRSSKNKLRVIQLIAHSHLGYFTFIMAAISALLAVYNNECLEIIILITLICLVPVILHIVSGVLDCMTDTKLGIRPRRRQYPILEPIRLVKRGPCEPCKWAAFFALILLLMALWLLVVLSANFSSKKDPDKFDPNIPTGSVSSAYSGPEETFTGVFGVCGYVGGNQRSGK